MYIRMPDVADKKVTPSAVPAAAAPNTTTNNMGGGVLPTTTTSMAPPQTETGGDGDSPRTSVAIKTNLTGPVSAPNKTSSPSIPTGGSSGAGNVPVAPSAQPATSTNSRGETASGSVAGQSGVSTGAGGQSSPSESTPESTEPPEQPPKQQVAPNEPSEEELRDQQKKEEDSNFDFILFLLLFPAAILIDIVCIIPILSETVGEIALVGARGLFWLLNIRPGRLIENLIKRILEQQSKGAGAGPGIPLPKESGVLIKLIFETLFGALAIVRLTPIASEVSFATTIFITTTFVLCKVEEHIIKKVKRTLKELGKVGRVVAQLPLPPQVRAIGAAAAIGDDVVNKGRPAGEAVAEQAANVASSKAGGAVGVGEQVGVGARAGAAAGGARAGAEGSPLVSDSPSYGDTSAAQLKQPRTKSEFARAQQRMDMQSRLQKRINKKFGTEGRTFDDVQNISGEDDQGDGANGGGRFAGGKPSASGSPIVTDKKQ
jgi:hypothetical protein